MNKKKSFLIVLFITLIAAAIRLWGIGFGLPHTFHPDEPKALVFVKYCWDGNFSPYPIKWDPLYGTFTFIVFFFQKLFFLVLKLFGYHPFLQNHKEFFFSSELTYLISRIPTALMGALTVPLTYLIAKKLYNKYVGIAAALFLTFSISHIANSHYIKPDVPVTFFVTLAMLFAVFIYQKGFLWAYILSGLCVGLSFTTKMNGAAIFITGITAHILFSLKNKSSLKRMFLAKNIYFFITAIFAGIFIGCPYIFIDFNGFIGQIKWFILDQAHGRGPIFFRWGWIHFFRNINSGMGLPLAILSYCGILYSIIQRKSKHLLLFSFPILYYLITGRSTFIAQRYTILVIPFLCISGGLFLDATVKKTPKIKYTLLYSVLLSIILFFPVRASIVDGYFMWEESTRTIAERWINQNIPHGSSIATENYTPVLSRREYKLLKCPVLGFQPVENYVKLGYEYLITANFAHDRYINSQIKYEFPIHTKFYSDLNDKYHLVKEFRLKASGFSNPQIRIYKLSTKNNPTPPFIPHIPPSHTRNNDSYFVNGDPVFSENLNPSLIPTNMYLKRTVVSDKKIETLGFLFVNSKDSNSIHGTIKAILSPLEKKVVLISPKTSLLPVNYLYTIKLSAKKHNSTQVSILTNPYQIAQAYITIGDWEKAVVHLEKVVTEQPENSEAFLLLLSAYNISNKNDKFIALQKTIAPEFLNKYCDLALTIDKSLWDIKFKELFNLSPQDLLQTLRTIYTPKDLLLKTGIATPQSCSFDKNQDEPGTFIYKPLKQFPPGIFNVSFNIKAHDQTTSKIAALDISANSGITKLAEKDIFGSDFSHNDSYKAFHLNFYNPSWNNELEIQIIASGNSSFCVRDIVIEPDLNYFLKKNLMTFFSSGNNFEKALSFDIPDPFLYTMLADKYVRNDDIQSAISIYEKLLQIEPKNTNIINELRNLLYKAGNTAKSLIMDIMTDSLYPEELKTITFEDEIEFLGYKVINKNLKPSDTFEITYYWKCLKKVDRNLTIFVHFTKKSGKIKFQNDHQPHGAAYPTSMWIPGEIITETSKVTIPDNLEKGTYDIQIGIYDPLLSSKRMLVTSTDLPHSKNRVIIGSISVD